MKLIWIHLLNGQANLDIFATMSKMITLTFLLMMNSPISRSGFLRDIFTDISIRDLLTVGRSLTFQKSRRITLFKDYEGNDPVEEGWYDWHKLESLSESAAKFRILIKSDKSRQMYGFKLNWQTNSAKCGKNCTEELGNNSKCDEFSGSCVCKDGFELRGTNCSR